MIKRRKGCSSVVNCRWAGSGKLDKFGKQFLLEGERVVLTYDKYILHGVIASRNYKVTLSVCDSTQESKVLILCLLLQLPNLTPNLANF